MDMLTDLKLHEKKLKYNEILTRYLDAELYFNNENISMQDKLKYTSTLKGIIDELGKLLDEIGTYTEDEVLDGFEIADEGGNTYGNCL